jgi:hypothetical protein
MMRIELERSIFDTATIGAVIEALERASPEADLHFDFCYLRPTTGCELSRRLFAACHRLVGPAGN